MLPRSAGSVTANAGATAAGNASAGIVTPEAVVLELDTAGLSSRVLARLVDTGAQFGIILAALLVLNVATSNADLPSWLAIALVTVIVALALIGYPVLFEATMSGRTPGKAALGIRVLTTEGAPIRWRHAVTRGLVGVVDFFVPVPGGAVAVLSVVASKQSQRLGDMAAGTRVVHYRAPRRQNGPSWFVAPPGWEAYIASLDTSRLSADEYALVRSFLLRSGELTPPARDALAVRLANPVAVDMHHTPPTQVSAEFFLYCVAAAYQQRHHAGGPVAPAPWSGRVASAGR